MKTLHCSACSSRDLKEIRPGEYECNYCGARTLSDSVATGATGAGVPGNSRSAVPGKSVPGVCGKSGSVAPGGSGSGVPGGSGSVAPGGSGAACGNTRGVAVGTGPARGRLILFALLAGIFCLGGVLVAVLLEKPSESLRSSGPDASSSGVDAALSRPDENSMQDSARAVGDSGIEVGTSAKRQPQPAQVFGVEAIEKPPEVATELGKFVFLPDGIGNTYFVGMVKNTGDAVIDHPQVELSLFDAKGKLVAVSHGYSDQAYLFPGEEVPVKVLVSDTPAYHHFEAAIDPEPASIDPVRLRLTIANARLTPEKYQGYRVRGEITNEDKLTATYVQVIALLLDGKGRAIGMDSSFLGKKKLGPGETAPFEVGISLVKGKPESFKLYYGHLVERE